LTTSVAAFTPFSLASLARTTTTSSASRSSSGGVTAFGLVRRARASSSLAMAGPYEEPDPNFDYDMVVIGVLKIRYLDRQVSIGDRTILAFDISLR